MVCLNSFRRVHSRRSSARSSRRPRLRSMNRTNTASSPTMKVGTPNTLPALDRLGVLGGEHLQRPAAQRLGGDGVGVEPDGRSTASRSTSSWRSSCPGRGGRRTRRRAQSRKLLGERVADRDAPEQREHAGAPLARVALPHRRLALLDVHLVEREREEPHVQSAPSRRAVTTASWALRAKGQR